MDDKTRFWLGDNEEHDSQSHSRENDHDDETAEEECDKKKPGKKTGEAGEEARPSVPREKPKPIKSRVSHSKHSSRKRDGMPRRPLSAYNFFFKEQREVLLHEREQEQQIVASSNSSDVPKIGFESMAKIIGARWKRIPQDDLNRFKGLAENDNKRYRSEMDEYLREAAAEIARNRQERPRPVMLPLSTHIGTANIGNEYSGTPGVMSMGNMLSMLTSPPAPLSLKRTSDTSNQSHTSQDTKQDKNEKMRLSAKTEPRIPIRESYETDSKRNENVVQKEGEKPAAMEPGHGQVVSFPDQWQRWQFSTGSNSGMGESLGTTNQDPRGYSFPLHAAASEQKIPPDQRSSQNSALEDLEENMYLETLPEAPRLQAHSIYEQQAQNLFSFGSYGNASMAAVAPPQQSGEAAFLRLIDQFSSFESPEAIDVESWMELMEPRHVAPGATAAESVSVESQQVSQNQPASRDTYQQQFHDHSGVARHQPNLHDANDLSEFAWWFGNM